MSNAIATIDTGNYPAIGDQSEDLAEIIQDNLGDELSESDFQRIKAPKGGATQFTIPNIEGDELTDSVKGVIIYHTKRKAYWEESFGTSPSGTPPNCISNNGITGVGTPGGICAKCPQGQWGSSEQGKGKACTDFVLLFIIRPGQLMPNLLRVPPTNIKVVRDYFSMLINARLAHWQVETEITAVLGKSGQGLDLSKLQLKAIGQVPADKVDSTKATHKAIKRAAEGMDIIDIVQDD